MPDTSYPMKPAERAVFSLRALYRTYGYQHYTVSRFEEYELYLKNKSFLTDDKILAFTDTDGKLLALKPDVTLSIIKNTKESNGLRKVYYNESVYRANGGHFREIMQTGLECIGNIDAYAVTEVVLLAYRSLSALHPEFLLDLSHMGFVSALLSEMKADRDTERRLLEALGSKNVGAIAEIGREAGIASELTACLSRIAELYGTPDEILPVLAQLSKNAGMAAAVCELREICDALAQTNAASRLRLDFSIINDMNYYSGIIFQGFLPGIPSSVLSGGRYDNLIRRMGKAGGAIGFAVYLDGLERTDAKPENDVDVLLVYDESTPLSDITDAVAKLTEEGKTVRAQCGDATDLRVGEIRHIAKDA